MNLNGCETDLVSDISVAVPPGMSADMQDTTALMLN